MSKSREEWIDPLLLEVQDVLVALYGQLVGAGQRLDSGVPCTGWQR